MKKISIVLVIAIIVFFSAGCNRQKNAFMVLFTTKKPTSVTVFKRVTGTIFQT